MLIPLDDGLYRVENQYLCAGFVVEAGRLVMCAPILRKGVTGYWWKRAVRVSD